MPHPYLYPPGLDYFQLQSETLWLLSRTAERSTGSREGHGLAKFIFALGKGVHVLNKFKGLRGISVGLQFDLAKLVRPSWVGP